jgi:hypothetical protein
MPPLSGRNGDIRAGGKLFVGVETSASKAAEAILIDLKAKHIIIN